jgi:hypothetical protein
MGNETAPQRPTKVDWIKVRAAWECGTKSDAELSRVFGVSRTAIQKRCKAERWVRDLEEAIERATNAEVAGTVAARNPQETQAAIAAEAQRRADVVRRHKLQWEEVAKVRSEALRVSRTSTAEKDAFAKLKTAKILAEVTTLLQAGERKAHGLDRTKPDPNEPTIIQVIRERDREPDQDDDDDTQGAASVDEAEA